MATKQTKQPAPLEPDQPVVLPSPSITVQLADGTTVNALLCDVTFDSIMTAARFLAGEVALKRTMG